MSTTTAEASPEAIVIKKYANRRLYNTATSSYVTLDTLCQMVKDGTEFVVFDAKTGENITKPVLTQIIFEEEAKGQNLLPASFLRQLIRFYGDSLQALVPNYLEMSMEAFTRNQEQFRQYVSDAFGGITPFAPLDEMNKQNMAMFQRAMEMFNPFAAAEHLPGMPSAGRAPSPRPPAPAADGTSEMDVLRSQLNALQQRFDALTGEAGTQGGGGSAERHSDSAAAADPRKDLPGSGKKTG
ncbi:polyhydroxyalkanoate synthesis repressor PhaR [Marinibaculum pumilum]|uniref:Polyhydroxyalkanoate synthesis repressor PhaR n=1 Tax=Marinibaculum pumilum TaxID=1766165 RepID=A0ABV7L5Z5_9PROT